MYVPSIHGDGNSGHYALVASATAYHSNTGVDFESPGGKPFHPAAATSAQIMEGNQQFAADVTKFSLNAPTEAGLKCLLLLIASTSKIGEKTN
jgi:hypothetical protein